jgi:hypothetical protein
MSAISAVKVFPTLTAVFLLHFFSFCDGVNNQGTSSQPPTGQPQTVCQQVAINPVAGGLTELHDPILSRDECEIPTPAEALSGQGHDTQLAASLPTTTLFASQIATLKSQAGIDPSVPIYVTPDILCGNSFAGGITGYGIIFVDGKFLAVLYEYATYLALVDLNEAPTDQFTAINNIVYAHSAAPCVDLGEQVFFRSSLTPAGVALATKHFDSLSGAIMYHEYGHYWAWAYVDSLRLQFVPGAQLFYYPSKIEDDADFISGALSKRAGHELALGQQMFDLMAFEGFLRLGLASNIQQIDSAYAQFLQTSPSYQSLAGRKQTFANGYAGYQ